MIVDLNLPFWRKRVASRALISGVTVLGLVLTGCSLGGEQGATYEEQLAAHLTQQGAAMYGAFWCPHCESQKALFGKAVDSVPYVECDAQGEDAQPQLCIDKGIEGYPTWEIDGEFYPGTRSLEELAQLSGYESAQ